MRRDFRKYGPSHLALALCAIAVVTIAQAPAQSTPNTSFWTGNAGNGLWNTAGNWDIATSGNPTLPPQAQAVANRNVLFSNSNGTTSTITLSAATSLGLGSGAGDFNVRQGAFLFQLSGKNLAFADLVLGNGVTSGTALFQNSSATQSTLSIGGVAFAGNGGSYQLADVVSNLNGSVSGNVNLFWRGGYSISVGGTAAGVNNSLHVGTGQLVTLNEYSIVLNASSTTGNSNNRLEVDGGTLVTGANGGDILVKGYYDASDPDNVIRANNEVFVHNGGQISSGSRGMIIGAGSQARIETGGKINGSGASVEQYGELLVDGAGSQLNGNLNVSGSATFSNGAELSNTVNVTVGSTGHLVMDNVVVASGSANISGQLEVRNGSSYSTTSDLGASGQLIIDGGQVTVGRQFSGTATIQGGGVLMTDRYTGGSGVTVDEGSTFRFETWTGAGELAVNGKVTWGAGNDASGTMMKVMAGTTLVLDGGNYTLGRFGLMEGSALEGSGVIDATMESMTGGVGGPLDGGVRGASINPGTADSVGRLEFTQNVLFMDSPSQITFSILDADNYDQIAGNLQIGSTELVIKLELMQPLEDIIASFEAGVTSFQLVSTAAGGPISLGLVGGGLITYDFNGTDEELAAYDLAWDTSKFASTGAIGLVAVPEPSTFVLLGLGATLALGRRRKRSAALAA